MTTHDFQISKGLEVDSYNIDIYNIIDGQTLVYNGDSYVPSDIVPIGTIEMWAGSSNPPEGWLLCNGQSYSWNQHTRLRDVIGISYGGSLGTSWNVPNLVSSSTPVIPVGTQAGQELDISSKLFNSTSISHTHNYNSSTYGSNTGGYGNHRHGTSSQTSHSHGLNYNNWNHYHNSEGPSNNHSHNYIRGNSGSNTDNRAHGGHNVSNNSHNHIHNGNSNSITHSHGYNAFGDNHSHNWNMIATTNSAGGNHNHTVNKQSIYYIIKY